MTTPEAERLYQHQHIWKWRGTPCAVFNPHGRAEHELPVIYGFNNGGPSNNLLGCLIAEDGTELGSHSCSHECYMPHDLGVLQGTRPDRHKYFKKHYPDGYRMDFVSYDDFDSHDGIKEALAKLQKVEGIK